MVKFSSKHRHQEAFNVQTRGKREKLEKKAKLYATLSALKQQQITT